MGPSTKLNFASAGVTPEAYKPVLVGLSCAAVELGVTPETATQLAEAGSLRFVFDLGAAGAKRRTLRFWVGELRQASRGAVESTDAVLEEIAGPAISAELRTRTVSARLQTTRTVVHGWLAGGELQGRKDRQGRQWISRANLVEFLKRRLCK